MLFSIHSGRQSLFVRAHSRAQARVRACNIFDVDASHVKVSDPLPDYSIPESYGAHGYDIAARTAEPYRGDKKTHAIAWRKPVSVKTIAKARALADEMAALLH